jgi:uncharacterized membrane protein YeiH
MHDAFCVSWAVQRTCMPWQPLLGAAIAVTAHVLQWPSGWAAVVGAAFCFGLRILAMKYGWHLPMASADS